MLPDVPWLSPESFIHRHFATIASRSLRSSLVMASPEATTDLSTGIEGRLGGDEAAHFLCRLRRGNAHGLQRGAGDMGRQRDVLESEQRPVGGRRLDGEGLEHGAAQVL